MPWTGLVWGVTLTVVAVVDGPTGFSVGGIHVTVDERVFRVFQRTMAADCRWEDWREADSLQSLSAMDSVGILDFVLALEHEFGLKFPIDDLQMDLFMNRPRLVNYVTDKLAGLTC